MTIGEMSVGPGMSLVHKESEVLWETFWYFLDYYLHILIKQPCFILYNVGGSGLSILGA